MSFVHHRPGLFLVDASTLQEKGASGMDDPSLIRALTSLPDGTTVAFGSDDGRVGLWRLEPRPTSPTFPGHAPAEAFELKGTGEMATYQGRAFCPRCGSRLLNPPGPGDSLIEIRIGTLDSDAPWA